jgi:hypothetical protein
LINLKLKEGVGMQSEIKIFRFTGYAAEVKISSKLGAIRDSPFKNLKM